jgi:hypothetical protein
MAFQINKKVLCFIDENGTAGSGNLCIGIVIVLAKEASRFDKCFTDQLEPNANEIHASEMSDGYLQNLMLRFWEESRSERIVLINRKAGLADLPPPALYAHAVIEAVKIGLKRFQTDVLCRERIGNVEVIIDANHHNGHELYEHTIAKAQAESGRFRAVTHVARIDSAASRLLQLADVVAYSRKWIRSPEMNAGYLHDRYGIQLI